MLPRKILDTIGGTMMLDTSVETGLAVGCNFQDWLCNFSALHPKQSVRGGGGFSPKSYVDVPAGPRKSDFLYTNFFA